MRLALRFKDDRELKAEEEAAQRTLWALEVVLNEADRKLRELVPAGDRT